MIVVWPLIVSKTVNPNVLPGVCKALEKYVHVSETDRIIDAANDQIAKKNKKNSTYLTLKTIAGKLSIRAEQLEPGITIEDYIEEGKAGSGKGPGSPGSSSPPPAPRGPRAAAKSSSDRDSYQDGYDKQKGMQAAQELRPVKPEFGRMDSAAISTEPTWNTVTDQAGNVTAIGVKVVPFVIDNEQSLVKLMTLDRYRKSLSTDVHKQARKVLRFMYKIANVSWKATIGKMLSWTGFVDKDLVAGTITKNWKNDIILQNTAFDNKMFILLNKMDLDEEFTTSAKGVKKLFGLGWTSFVIADDVNKVATFCMKNYKGMCSIVNYGFLYSDARSQSQVYQDIDDIRRNAGPMFRMKRRKKSMITDNLAQYKLDQYSTDVLLSESTLNESVIPNLIKQLKTSPDKMASNLKSIQSAVKRKDMKLAYKIIKKFNPSNKPMELSKVINKAKQTNPEFKKHYDLAYRIFKNSLNGLEEEPLKVGAAAMASIAVIGKKKNYDMKSDIKKIVMKTRASITLDEDDDNFSKDLKTAFIFAIITVVFSTGAIVAILYGLSLLLPAIGAAIFSIWPYLVFFITMAYGFKLLSAVKGGGDD